jgi:hypothetical protein
LHLKIAFGGVDKFALELRRDGAERLLQGDQFDDGRVRKEKLPYASDGFVWRSAMRGVDSSVALSLTMRRSQSRSQA